MNRVVNAVLLAVALVLVLSYPGQARAVPFPGVGGGVTDIAVAGGAGDGSFTPSSTTIDAGDQLRFTGLGEFDSIVRITDPGAGDPCSDAFKVTFGPAATEFTGPMRVGVPGIYAFGGAGDGITGSTVQTIATDCAACGDDTLCAPQANGNELCPGVGPPGILNEVFATPWVSGVKVDLDWIFVETAENVYDWTLVDLLLNDCADYGKGCSLSFGAGTSGTPPWLATATPAVSLIATKDQNDGRPGPSNCGTAANMGRPGDPNFDHHYWDDPDESLLADFAEHVKSNAAWRHALVEIRLNGANQDTPQEQKLARSCCDGCDPQVNIGNTLAAIDGRLDTLAGASGAGAPDACICNPQKWALAGLTPDELYAYYTGQAAAVSEYFGDLTRSYSLIQDGWPKLEDATNFEGDTLFDTDGVTPLLSTGTTLDDVDIVTAITMTETIINRLVSTYGNSGLVMIQHLGTDILPVDQGKSACTYASIVNSALDPPAAPLIPFGTNINKPQQSGCPNLWSTEVGVEDHALSGGQNENDQHGFGSYTNPVETGAEVASLLWNATTGANYTVQELYTKWVWQLQNHFGATTDIDARLCTTVSSGVSGTCAKNLTEWRNELVTRRQSFGGTAYPTTYTTPAFNTPGTYYAYNARTCSAGVGKKITITVNP